MKLSALWKDTFREIKGTWTRFLSITLIILLGVSFFVGISAAGPDMKGTVNEYYDNYNLMDQHILSTVGIKDEDVEVMNSVEGAHAHPGYHKDIVTEDEQLTMRLYGFDPAAEEALNEYRVVEGRLPENSGEIALDSMEDITNQYAIGDTFTVSLEESPDDTEESLETQEFEVVGYVNSPMFVEKPRRGGTPIGSGILEGFGVISKSDFNLDTYTEAYITYDELNDVEAYTDEYERIIEDKNSQMEETLAPQAEERGEEIRREIEGDLDQARTELSDAQETYDSLLALSQFAPLPEEAPSLEELESLITEGRESIDEAENALEDMPEAEFIVSDRSDNPGYLEYGENADRISAIARVFPVFFFLIAILVSYTTMTRMVQEGRGQMGIMKAFGYDNRHILTKYLVYAVLAGLIGTVLGLFLGYWLFPSVVYFAYGSLYNTPDLIIQQYTPYTIVAFIGAIVATAGATLVSMRKPLSLSASELLRPSSPESGKHILLERIPALWNRLSFKYKITFRNLFRYKGRMWMTILGVAGCTALILTGFGISDSVNSILTNQYDKISTYDAAVIMDSETEDDILNSFDEVLADQEGVTDALGVYQETYDVLSEAEETEETIMMVVPSDVEKFSNYRHLFDAETEEELRLSDEGAFITQKIAEDMNLQTGDTIEITFEGEETFEVPINGVVKNHIDNFLYMTPEVYSGLIGGDDQLVRNNYWLQTDDDNAEEQEAISQSLMEEEEVVNVTFTDTVREGFGDTLDALDLVVLVLIAAAALLAFIVLYNLTNINIGERIGELSTIKVLGFYDKEVTMYIYRENMFLTLLGILVGFGMGILLHRYIILTVENSVLMFGRTILLPSYIYSALLTLLFATIVMLVMHRLLKNVDMVEALSADD